MLGNKLLLNEAPRLDPQLEPPKYLQFNTNYFNETFNFFSISLHLVVTVAKQKILDLTCSVQYHSE